MCTHYNVHKENIMKFEWDQKKNIINKKKHGISFEQAIHVFSDPNLISFFDIEHSCEEDREILLGKIGGGHLLILYVVITQRKDVIRLISARKATNKEERFYYEKNQG